MLSFDQRLQSASDRLHASIERIRSLGKTAPEQRLREEALAFNLERAAWALIELAQAWVFELRLGIPRKETENFDLLQRHGWLDIESARRFKQLCEFRSLSQREAGRTDWAYLGGDLSAELALMADWDARCREWKDRARP